MDLTDLPGELKTLLAQNLSVDDVAAYCVSDRTFAKMCSDRSFWIAILHNLDRRSIQVDWVIGLARRGEGRLLSNLLDGIDTLKIVLDDWARIVALMHLEINSNQNRPVRSIAYEKLRQKIGAQISNYKGSYSSWESNVITAQELWNLTLKQWIEDDRVENMNVNVRWTIHYFYEEIAAPFLARLPSPTYLLSVVLNTDDYKEKTNYVSLLTDWLLPYLVRNNEIELLKTYKNDLVALQDEIADYTIRWNLHIDSFLDALRYSVMEYGTLEMAEELDIDISECVRDSLGYIFVENPDMFRKIASMQDYHVYNSSGGYLSLEPKEWIEWFETIPPSADKKQIITFTLIYAKGHGFTYFEQIVNVYAKKNGYRE